MLQILFSTHTIRKNLPITFTNRPSITILVTRRILMMAGITEVAAQPRRRVKEDTFRPLRTHLQSWKDIQDCRYFLRVEAWCSILLITPNWSTTPRISLSAG